MAFYQVRSLFAQIVEGVILLDRLVHILQQVSDLDDIKLILGLDSAVRDLAKCWIRLQWAMFLDLINMLDCIR